MLKLCRSGWDCLISVFKSRWDWSSISVRAGQIVQECLMQSAGLVLSVGVGGVSQECLWELDKHSTQVGEIGHKCLWEQMAGLQCL